MSPPITKEPIKLTISLKGHRKHRRRKAKRDRRSRPSTSADDKRDSPSDALQFVDDRFWPLDDGPGPSTRYLSPNLLGEPASHSSRLKASESSDSGEDFPARLSPGVLVEAERHSSDEQSRRRVRKKSRRKSRRREPEAEPCSPTVRSRILPVVEPLRLSLSSRNTQFAESASTIHKDASDPTCRVISEGSRSRPETRKHLHVRQTSTRSAFTDVAHGFSVPSSLPSTPHLSTRFLSQPSNVETVSPEEDELAHPIVLVGQPSQRAVAAPSMVLPRVPPVSAAHAAQWIYPQSGISTQSTTLSAHNNRLAQEAAVESDTFRSEPIPFDPVTKPSHMESSVLTRTATDSIMEEQQLPSLPHTEINKTVYQKKSRQPSGSQELWEPLGIKSPTYGIILPVATKNDNDADDATVAFLTSSPELLSEDDICAVKEEADELQGSILLKGTSPSRVLRQRIRSATKLTSESSDTDQRTIIDLEEDQVERRSSDRDGDVLKLSAELAALSQLSEQRHTGSGQSSEQESVGNRVIMEERGDERKPESASSSVAEQSLENNVVDDLAISRDLQLESSPEECNHILVLDGPQDLSATFGHPLEYSEAEPVGQVLAQSPKSISFLMDVPTTAGVDDESSSQQEMVPRTGAMSVDNVGEPIRVIISSRTEKNIELGVPLETREGHYGRMASAYVQPPEREEENLYDDDYSTDDEELMHFHGESERNCQEMPQQSQYEQLLSSQHFPSIVPATQLYNQAPFGQATFSYQPRAAHVLPGWPSQNSTVTRLESSHLSVQTVFENAHQVPSHHSHPALQTAVAHIASGAAASHSSSVAVSQASQYHQQHAPPPHTFPLQRSQAQRNDNVQNEPQQQKHRKDPRGEIFDGSGLAGSEVRALKRSFAPTYPTDTRPNLQYSLKQPLQVNAKDIAHRLHQRRDSSEMLEAPPSGQNVPIQPAPPPRQQAVCHHQAILGEDLRNQLPLKKQHTVPEESERTPVQQRHPAELMEEEMRAMRYVYLMNEQRIAKKSLAERDKNATKKPTPSKDLMFLSELPPIMVEPTVIPEGIPRTRMQEHLLPPYHHAQFAIRSGLCVSPFRSDASEDELTKVKEVLDLEALEPMGTRTIVPKTQGQSGQVANSEKECRNIPYRAPSAVLPGRMRQQHPSGTSVRSEQHFHTSEEQRHLPASEVEKMDAAQSAATESLFSSKTSQSLSPLEVAIPQQMDISSTSREAELLSNEEQSDASDDEMWSVEEKEHQGGTSNDDDSTDSETVRRGWDLSPSVSPLTLEAFTSILSSPEGSDSNDDQIGVPVWSTMSRKHAKLAIAVCRNMPKRLQPLCRRFAWQQGITYLLENFCLQKWEIRPEHDVESVWFFEKLVRRFKPFDVVPWEINDSDESEEKPKRVENVFFGFNICADIPFSRCRKTIRIEDRAFLSLTCKQFKGITVGSSSDTSDDESVNKAINETVPTAPLTSSDESASTEDEDECSSDEEVEHLKRSRAALRFKALPQKLSYEQQEFIAMSCCKQFIQQMVTRKNGDCFRVGDRSAVQVTSILSELYREHRDAYELLIADIVPIPTPDQREIPFSDNAEWVASRILAINRAQNRLLIPTFPPWAAMHRLWKVYGPLQQCASAIGGDFEKFVAECVSVAYNHYYRLKNGIKVADEIPGDLLDLCYAITSERMREHTESVEAAKKRADKKTKPSKAWIPLKRREGLCTFSSQRTANAQLLSRCRRVYNEKRQTKRRRWNTMRYLHNALPGCVIEGIDVFDMAQRTNLSVAGIFGPEHKLKLTEMPFASDLDNRPAYLDMEELLELMDRTLVLQSGSTVDQEGSKQPSVDFLTVHGLHFKAITGERGRCHLMVSPAPIPVPPVVIDHYGNVTAIQRAAVPKCEHISL
ncbi:hypothetical protein COOONC_00261 [Cooperia oncophora]